MVYTLNATALPFGIKIGDLRSGPPPVGNTVVLTALRVLTGTEGYSRNARPDLSEFGPCISRGNIRETNFLS